MDGRIDKRSKNLPVSEIKSLLSLIPVNLEEFKETPPEEFNITPFLKWNILKKGLSLKDLSKFDKDKVWKSFWSVRHYISHFYHHETLFFDLYCLLRSVLSKLIKDFSAKESVLNFFGELFDSITKEEKNLAKFMFLFFYLSLVTYRNEFGIWKNEVIRNLGSKDKYDLERKSNWRKDFIDSCKKFEEIVRLDKNPFLPELDKTLWIVHKLKHIQKKLESSNDLEEMNLFFIVEFWDKFFPKSKSGLEVDFRLKNFYACQNCLNDLLEGDKSESKGKREEWESEGSKYNDEVCSLKKDLKQCSNNFLYRKKERGYQIKNNVFYFVLKKNNKLKFFATGAKTVRSLFLWLFLKGLNFAENQILENVFKKFWDFLQKCFGIGSTLPMFNDLKDNLLLSNKFLQKKDKLCYFKNWTFFKKYCLISTKEKEDRFSKYDFKNKYSFEEFWKNRKKWRIWKLKNLQKNLVNFIEDENCACFDKKNSNEKKQIKKCPHRVFCRFKDLVKNFQKEQGSEKQRYLKELRLRLSFVFKTLNSLYLESCLQKEDFNTLFEQSFSSLFSKKEDFNVYNILKKKCEERKLTKTIPERLASFDLNNFDYFFSELVDERIALIEGLEPDMELFTNSILKSKKNISETVTRINYLWLKKFFFEDKELKQFLSENILDDVYEFIFKLKKVRIEDSKKFDYKTGKEHSAKFKIWEESWKNFKIWEKFSWTLNYCLIVFCRNYFSQKTQKHYQLENSNKKFKIVFPDPISKFLSGFFEKELHLVLRKDNLPEITIILEKITKFQWEKIRMFELHNYDKVEKLLGQKKKIKFSELLEIREKIFLEKSKFPSLLKKNVVLKFSTLAGWFLQFEEFVYRNKDDARKKTWYIEFEEVFRNSAEYKKMSSTLREAIEGVRNNVFHEKDTTKFTPDWKEAIVTLFKKRILKIEQNKKSKEIKLN